MKRFAPSFTLIELMAASTVLSVVLLLMVGMQDQMSRAWSNASRRTETGREARAALRMMCSDLSGMKLRSQGPVASYRAAMSDLVKNRPVPFVYYNGSGADPLSIGSRHSNSAYVFMVTPEALSTNGDLNLIGYYVASRLSTNLSGLRTTNFHLMRYRRDSATTAANLATWFASPTDPKTLFSGVSAATDEILAYNVANLSILCLGQGIQLSGAISQPNLATGTFIGFKDVPDYGARIHLSLTVFPEISAQRIDPRQWGGYLAKEGRTYEGRVRRMAREEE